MSEILFLLVFIISFEIGFQIVQSYKKNEINNDLIRENLELKKKLGD